MVHSIFFFAEMMRMADGKEDLREKNGESEPLSGRYEEWRVLQGREDAEMLQEKSSSWKNERDWMEKHDRDDYE